MDSAYAGRRRQAGSTWQTSPAGAEQHISDQ